MAPSLLPKAAVTAPPPTETTKRLYDLLDGKRQQQQRKKKQKVATKSSTNAPKKTTLSNAALPTKSTTTTAAAAAATAAVPGGSFSSVVSKLEATAAASQNRNVFGMDTTLTLEVAASAFRAGVTTASKTTAPPPPPPSFPKRGGPTIMPAKENSGNAHLVKPKVKSVTERKQKSHRNAMTQQNAVTALVVPKSQTATKSSAQTKNHQVQALRKKPAPHPPVSIAQQQQQQQHKPKAAANSSQKQSSSQRSSSSTSLHLNLLRRRPSSSITQQKQQQQQQQQKRPRFSTTQFAQIDLPESSQQQQIVLPHPATKRNTILQRCGGAAAATDGPETTAVIQTTTTTTTTTAVSNTTSASQRAFNKNTAKALPNTTRTAHDDNNFLSGSASSEEAFAPTALAPPKVSLNTTCTATTTTAATTTTLTTTSFQPEQHRPSTAWQDIPRPLVIQNEEAAAAATRTDSHSRNSSNTSQSKRANQGNFVRLNLRNAAGACLGARNRKARRKATLLREQRQQQQQQQEWHNKNQQYDDDDDETTTFASSTHNTRLQGNTVRPVSRTGVDPVDDYLDGVYTTATNATTTTTNNKQRKNDVIPKCSGHQRPCKLLTVKKTTSGNKGRPFYCCSFPRGEQCDYFEWADDTVEATRQALAKNTSPTGFVARQVAAYMERIKSLTVPELKTLAHKHGLSSSSSSKCKKQQLLTRLAIWVRDELSSTLSTIETNEHDGAALSETTAVPTIDKDHFSDDEDDCLSSSDEELELFVDKGGGDDSDDDDDDDDSMNESEDQQDVMVENRPSVVQKNDACPIRSKLFSVFGHEDFREGQEWAVQRCLDHNNSLLVAPTGFGKSLCYALPAALMSGTCIVVSPLLSLIQDQIRILPPRLPAATLSGQMSTASMAATLDDIIRGRIKILFVSPERLTSSSFRRMFRMKWNPENNRNERQFPTVSLLCVDEAHCLSQWGHNFRPSYLRIRSMTQMIQPQSVLAITATAGPRVVSDICQALDIQRTGNLESSECGVRVMSTNRDNIDVKSFVLATQEERLKKLLKILSPTKPKNSAKRTNASDGSLEDGCLSSGSVIVYVWRQRDAEAVAENIQAAGITGGVVVYHGGMEAAARSRAQSKFMRGKARICVATVAFGLGINKADVVGVIHMYLSASPEHFLQEIGRAGRDGRPATAISLILSDEVLIRNSLAHSDLMAKSQVAGVLSTLRSKAQDALSELVETRPDTEPINVSLLLQKTVISCDCKAETIETIISLLEERDGDPLVSIEGTSYDTVTIAPKRFKLVDMCQREPVAKAILSCATCIEPPAGEQLPSDQARQDNPFVGFTFGCYTFSVSDCSNYLGPAAEPRHVFAALRRLENNGEIAFRLDTAPTGRSLNMRLTTAGMSFFKRDDVGSLVDEIFCRFSQTIIANADKVLDLDFVLREVCRSSAIDTNTDQESDKSSSLVRFQELVNRYFEREGKGEHLFDDKILDSVFGRIPCSAKLLSDVLLALSYIGEAQASVEGDKLVKVGDENNFDYTVLTVTKFLHGIAPATLPVHLLRQHPLFGSLQGVQFGVLREGVSKLLQKK